MSDPLKILIVEDSIVSALMMEAQINRKEPAFQVRIRKTMKGAKEEYEAFGPNILLLDLNLPDSTGRESVDCIQYFRKACVLAMSGDDFLREPAMAAGAKDFIPKVIGEDATPFLKRITDLAPECIGSR